MPTSSGSTVRRDGSRTSTRGCRTPRPPAPEYDFEDIFEGLRTSTRWDFKLGNPLGTGGQWAIPWGFENNVVAYNKRIFDEKGIKKLPDKLDDFIQLAVDLTDRSQNRYGISTRGSKSWATIHPGFMTQYTREGRGGLHVQRLAS